MNNLTVRIISAVIMLVGGSIALTFSTTSRWALFTAGIGLGAWEFARMLDVKFATPKMAPFAGLWVATFGLLHWPGGLLPGQAELWLWGWVITGGMIYTLAGFRWVDIERLAPWLFMSLFGLLYLGPWTFHIFALFRPEAGWSGIYPLIVAYVGIALADIGAYATGRAFGRRKLCPQISAKKTIEGAVGGTCIGALATAFMAVWLLHWTLPKGLLLGLMVALSAVVGDLFISILKRYTGTKDASQLIPGHGGILDRFDSLFFTGPIAAFGIQILGS